MPEAIFPAASRLLTCSLWSASASDVTKRETVSTIPTQFVLWLFQVLSCGESVAGRQPVNWLCAALPDGPAAQSAASFALGEKFTFGEPVNPRVDVRYLPRLVPSLSLAATG